MFNFEFLSFFFSRSISTEPKKKKVLNDPYLPPNHNISQLLDELLDIQKEFDLWNRIGNYKSGHNSYNCTTLDWTVWHIKVLKIDFMFFLFHIFLFIEIHWRVF